MSQVGHNAPIIKRVKKGHHDGHHGGAWKVAYADFVTAMMAFFLLLWLLQVTTDDQKKGLADYFSPTNATLSRSGAGGVLAGRTFSDAGTRIGEGGTPSITVTLPPPGERLDGEEAEGAADQEQEAFDEAEDALRQALNDSEELSEIARHILVEQTGEGMRIQIIDHEGKSMFESGSAAMQAHTRQLIAQIAKVVGRLPNKISITGHTDATPFARGAYSNWELSTDRANASRRALLAAGIEPDRVVQVSGKADHEPLYPAEPQRSENRRISITLLRESTALPPDLAR